MFTITPRVPSSSGSPSAIFAAAWLSTLKVPIRFTSITLRKRSSGKPITRAPPPMPAQLTTPCSSSHESTSERTASSSVTSVSGRSAITTFAPSRSSIAAVASPSPERPPVTMNVLPRISTTPTEPMRAGTARGARSCGTCRPPSSGSRRRTRTHPAARTWRSWGRGTRAARPPVALCPSRSTQTASGRSSHFSCGIAITAASAIAGCAISAFSSSTDEIHSPPDLITSLERSLSIT